MSERTPKQVLDLIKAILRDSNYNDKEKVSLVQSLFWKIDSLRQ